MWNSTSDVYNGGCGGGWFNFTHYYYVAVSVQSPSYRSASNYGSSSAGGGGGYAESSTWLAIQGETGNFAASTVEQITCSIAGLIFYATGGQNVVGCADADRTTIIQEYTTFNVNTPHPACGDLTNSGGSTNFTWSELNGGFSNGNPHNPWGWIQTGLTTGIEDTRTNYGAAIYLSSGYRCPHGNASPSVQGAVQSYHMKGRAADMYRNSGHTWANEAEFNVLRTAAQNTNNTIELFNYNTYTDHHLHAAW